MAAAPTAQTPVAVFTCPTCDKVMAFPYVHSAAYINIAEPTPVIGRSDYAAILVKAAAIPARGLRVTWHGDSMSDVQWTNLGFTQPHTPALFTVAAWLKWPRLSTAPVSLI